MVVFFINGSILYLGLYTISMDVYFIYGCMATLTLLHECIDKVASLWNKAGSTTYSWGGAVKCDYEPQMKKLKCL